MSRRNVVTIAIGAVLVLALGWYVFFARDSAPGPAGGPGAGPPLGAIREVAVSVIHPVMKEFAHDVEALGTLRANESVDVTAKVTNRVVAIRFQEGQQVRTGQVLVELDSAQERADLAGAEAALLDSRSQFNRSRELYETRVLSEAQLDQLQATLSTNEARVAAARSRLSDTVVTAPFAGRVGLRHVSLGSLVAPGAIIATLDDLSVMKLDFAVPEVFLASLEPGQDVGARTAAYPDEVFRGRVSSIETRVDPSTRSVPVRALIDNPDGRLRPGMFMTVRLVRSEGEAMMLPEEAIVPEGDRHYVFLVEEERARRRQVEIGRRRPGEVEILSGLSIEDTVVVDGTLNVRENGPVRVVNRIAAEPS